MTDSSSHLPSAPDDRVDLRAILSAAVERGASDVHLKTGRPPIVRFDGELEPLPGFSPLGVLELREVVHHVGARSEEHTSELQSLRHLVCRLLLEKKNKTTTQDD